MGIFLGASEPSKIFVGDGEIASARVGTTKVRPTIVPVTGVTLNTATISFTSREQTIQLVATVLPNNATNKNVTWTSSNNSVATVSSSGLVTCKGNGNCTITVTTQDGGYTATCGVTAVVPRVFTISWTEKANMSSGWTYSDDAAGLTAGSTVFDEFFGYSAVRLNTNGVETASVTQTQSGGAGKLDITQLGTLTSGDNVMIKFPIRGIKMTKSGSTVTLSITEELNKSGYQYYAHTASGTINSPGTPKSAFYIGAYLGSLSGTVMKSWSGKSPNARGSPSDVCTYAKANNTNLLWNIAGYYQYNYIAALYMMKYGNPNAQTVVGKGYTGASGYANTGGTDSQTNATYGTTSNTTQSKLFGIEDFWGNKNEFIGGAYTNNSYQLCVQLSGYSGGMSGGTNTSIVIATSSGDISAVAGNNKGMFLPTGANGWDFTKYYTDVTSPGYNKVALHRGFRNDYDNGGVFGIDFQIDYGSYEQNAGRLMYI